MTPAPNGGPPRGRGTEVCDRVQRRRPSASSGRGRSRRRPRPLHRSRRQAVLCVVTDELLTVGAEVTRAGIEIHGPALGIVTDCHHQTVSAGTSPSSSPGHVQTPPAVNMQSPTRTRGDHDADGRLTTVSPAYAVQVGSAQSGRRPLLPEGGMQRWVPNAGLLSALL